MGKLRVILKKNKLMVALYPKYVKLKSKLRFWYMRLTTKVLTEEDLIAQLAQTGLKPGDAVMIHSSMSKIGILEKGPVTIVNALKRYIGPEGLIIMPTYPQKGMQEYLENYRIFDVRTTPSKDGAITECFRKSEGVVRSAHPTHPVAAWGNDAAQFVAGHEQCKTPFGVGSPFEKLIKMNAKLMLIGVNFDHLTIIRAMDDLEPGYKHVSYIPNKVYQVPVRMADGTEVMTETPCHDPVHFGAERWNMRLFSYTKSYMTFGHLGKAETWVLSAGDLYKVQLECMKQDIYTFYHYTYKPEYE
jgi:aminoglycoside 3-N-acetyltransferase